MPQKSLTDGQRTARTPRQPRNRPPVRKRRLTARGPVRRGGSPVRTTVPGRGDVGRLSCGMRGICVAGSGRSGRGHAAYQHWTREWRKEATDRTPPAVSPGWTIDADAVARYRAQVRYWYLLLGFLLRLVTRPSFPATMPSQPLLLLAVLAATILSIVFYTCRPPFPYAQHDG